MQGPILAALCSFSIFVFLGHQMTAALAFPALALCVTSTACQLSSRAHLLHWSALRAMLSRHTHLPAHPHCNTAQKLPWCMSGSCRLMMGQPCCTEYHAAWPC